MEMRHVKKYKPHTKFHKIKRSFPFLRVGVCTSAHTHIDRVECTIFLCDITSKKLTETPEMCIIKRIRDII